MSHRLQYVLGLCLVLGCSSTTAGEGGPGDDGGAGDDGGGKGDGPGGPDGGVPADLCHLDLPPGPARVLPPASDPRSAKAIYDEFFGQYLPANADFGWELAPSITVDWVESLHFPTPPAGLANETYHQYFDFNPHNFDRPGADAYASDTDNADLFASTTDPVEVLRGYDPTEWMPAVASTYTRTATSDIMASQFWYRASTPGFRAQLERALELCPDCDDVYTPLSHDDLYKIIELRFVRYGAAGPELSRTFKLIGVDSSGAMEAHALNDSWQYFGKIGGQTATAKWRMELSGLLAQRYWDSTNYIRLMPVLVRTSRAAALHQYYDGRFDREIAAADSFQRLVSPALDCTRDCHREICQAGRNLDGYGYVLRNTCTCGAVNDPLTALGTSWAAGACEAWTTGVHAKTPSSVTCPP
ncbi:MAG: hypothetical protein H6Q90_422 [Deltaproteobacteria bacterium]|nr:hypothetical protein [Deltaproteobacteria bacterium]